MGGGAVGGGEVGGGAVVGGTVGVVMVVRTTAVVGVVVVAPGPVPSWATKSAAARIDGIMATSVQTPGQPPGYRRNRVGPPAS